ncbi:MAG TPA: cobalamin-binding protein [Bacteroidaceae bacterium]|nr:cobalamin-binding protein [Bacteroidaceae bacterium]
METLLTKLSECVEKGKVEKESPYPPQMRGQEGANEITKAALDAGIKPEDILSQALIPAMEKVGQSFSDGKIFVPQMLMSAKAMGASMVHLKPFFQSGEVKTKGTFIIGTVKGDLHDIGKNLVAMMVEGAGWSIIDLGVDVNEDKFIRSIEENPGAVVGLSALLTTTMVNMEDIVRKIREKHQETRIIVGGAPLNNEFCSKIGADFYSPDPRGAVEYLKKISA